MSGKLIPFAAVVVLLWGADFGVRADEPLDAAAVSAEHRRAVEKGLIVLQRAAANYPRHKRCYSCHHQTLPLLAMTTARSRSLPIDEPLLAAQFDFSLATFRRQRDRLLAGKAVDGAALTVGYALWTAQFLNAPADDLFEAMADNLLQLQEDSGEWRPEVLRPPMEESRVTCTVLAAAGIARFAPARLTAAKDESLCKAAEWLRTAPLETHEDHVMRLWGARLLNEDRAEIVRLREAVLRRQRDDGGWSQLPTMASDAYATGQTLWVLQETGWAASEPACVRAAKFLTSTQDAQGAWHVRSRAKPVQTYFDNGDPYGMDQFLSIAATGWSVAAIGRMLK